MSYCPLSSSYHAMPSSSSVIGTIAQSLASLSCLGVCPRRLKVLASQDSARCCCRPSPALDAPSHAPPSTITLGAKTFTCASVHPLPNASLPSSASWPYLFAATRPLPRFGCTAVCQHDLHCSWHSVSSPVESTTCHDVDIFAVCWVLLCCHLDRLCSRRWGSHHAVNVHLHRRRFALGHLLSWVPPSSPPIPSSPALVIVADSTYIPSQASSCASPSSPSQTFALPSPYSPASIPACPTRRPCALDLANASSPASTRCGYGFPMCVVTAVVDCIAAAHPVLLSCLTSIHPPLDVRRRDFDRAFKVVRVAVYPNRIVLLHALPVVRSATARTPRLAGLASLSLRNPLKHQVPCLVFG
ncbi:hypothetical protein AB1N83_014242 [Pleurotus pulmonarius]